MKNKMFKYLKIENWTKVGSETTGFESSTDHRPIILLSQFCVFGALASLVHVVLDLTESESNNELIVDSFIIVILLLFYIINEKGYHLTARYLFLSTMNVVLFAYANVLPKEAGIYLVFFPLIGGTYIFTTQDNKLIKSVFITLPILALFTLEYLNYHAFGEVSISNMDMKNSFLVNLMLSTIVFSVAMNYLIKLNRKTEGVLTNSNEKYQKLAEEIEIKNKSLEKTNKELDRFAYSTSHDLRAPLLSVLGLINIAKMETNEPNISDYLDMMKDRVHNLDAFIKDITNYSRNSRLAVDPEPVEFDRTINDIIESYKFNENAAKITFNKNINMEAVVELDKKRLEVVLNNLVNNAIKYHDIEKEHPEVNLDVNYADGHVRISIKDNGLGIPEHNKDQIFDMFFRASEKSQGSGLGLYIVKETLEKINGQIEVYSELGVGSEFIVSIPAQEVKLELSDFY